MYTLIYINVSMYTHIYLFIYSFSIYTYNVTHPKTYVNNFQAIGLKENIKPKVKFDEYI